jgi:hypothetical protein
VCEAAGRTRLPVALPTNGQVACSWNTTSGYFHCSVKMPSGVQTETCHAYRIAMRENVGTGTHLCII